MRGHNQLVAITIIFQVNIVIYSIIHTAIISVIIIIIIIITIVVIVIVVVITKSIIMIKIKLLIAINNITKTYSLEAK